MLGSTPVTAVLGAAPGPDATLDEYKAFAKAATTAGLALLLIAPGAKTPVDMRTSRQRSADDKAAQEAAKEAGRPDWKRVKSRAGVHLATTDAALFGRYLTRYRETYGESTPVNMAIDVGRSGLIVVDADTADQVTAFLNDSGLDGVDVPPTVRTPGAVDSDGEWVHADGGHFYFTVPDGFTLPDRGTYAAPGGWVAMYGGRYVLIPPSVRTEGAYRLVGRDYPAPDWLLERISGDAAARFVDPAGRDEDMAGVIDRWAQTVSWADVLEPGGWTLTARPDSCGCPVWTAPGVHASPKSATTHDEGCTLGRYTLDNAPMHVWTDNPPEEFREWIDRTGSSTMSKLQAVAVTRYGGDVGSAATELDLVPDKTDALVLELGVDTGSMVSADDPDPVLPTPDAQPGPELSVVPDPADGGGASDGADAPLVDEEHMLKSETNGVPIIAPFDHWRNTEPPTWAIDGIIEHGATSLLIGPPGAGKSAVAIDMACAMVTGQRWQGRKTIRQRVLYLPGEGMSGAVQRILAWEQAHGQNVGRDLLLGDSIIQLGASSEAWQELAAYIIRHRVGLIIFDTFARMSLDIEENSATDVGKAVTRFDRLRTWTKAGVMVVHHTGKSSTSARGSSALWGAVESQILVTEGTWDASGIDGKPIDVSVDKQKNGEETEEPLPMMLTPAFDSIVVTGPSGEIGDPLDGVAAAPMVMPEPVIETAVRLREYLDRFPTQGLTRTDLFKYVRPDDHTLKTADPDLVWRRAVTEAVDLALRFGLIETLSGTASGSRYIPSHTTADQARQRAASEAMGE